MTPLTEAEARGAPTRRRITTCSSPSFKRNTAKAPLELTTKSKVSPDRSMAWAPSNSTDSKRYSGNFSFRYWIVGAYV